MSEDRQKLSEEGVNGSLLLEDRVTAVKYGEAVDYVPSDFALHFTNFIKAVNSTGDPNNPGDHNKTPISHLQMLDAVTMSPLQNIINVCHRGFSKTSIWGEYLFLYLCIYKYMPQLGHVRAAIYVANSMDKGAADLVESIRARINKSPFLQKFMDLEKTNIIQKSMKLVSADGNEIIIKLYGAATGVRGGKSGAIRPTLAIMDDLLKDTDAKSPTVIENLNNLINKAVRFALDPANKLTIWSGTPFNARDPLYTAIASGSYRVNVFPVCEKFPCTKKEFRGSWEDRFPYEAVLRDYNELKNNKDLAAFYQEYMLQTTSEEERLILEEDIRWYDRPLLLRHRSSYNFYITTDIGISESTAADMSVISIWAIDSEGNWFYVDGMAQRMTLDITLESLFEYVTIFKPMSVGIEVSGQQGGIVDVLRRDMIAKNIRFNLASDSNNNKPGIRPVKDKLSRFYLSVPDFKSGKMYFPKDHDHHEGLREMLDELRRATYLGFKSRHDDSLDTISMLQVMKPIKPRSRATSKAVQQGNRFVDSTTIRQLNYVKPRTNIYRV